MAVMNFAKAIALMLPVIVFALIAALMGPAGAGNLPHRHCLKFQSEKSRLSLQGTDGHFEKGPRWAKANLDEAQLARVKRWIAVTEALAFRCDARGMKAMQKRMKLPKFAKWRALKPPLPSRNPIFVELRQK